MMYVDKSIGTDDLITLILINSHYLPKLSKYKH